jgi:hypothetical protein
MIIPVIDARLYDCVDRSTGAPCNGPRCMAWRWFDPRHVHGFCGLAGEPSGMMEEHHVGSDDSDQRAAHLVLRNP